MILVSVISYDIVSCKNSGVLIGVQGEKNTNNKIVSIPRSNYQKCSYLDKRNMYMDS
jgi:hypothetical protein